MAGSWEKRVDFKEDFKESWQGLRVEFQYAAWTRVEGHLKQGDKMYSHGNMKNSLYIQGSKISLVLLG